MDKKVCTFLNVEVFLIYSNLVPLNYFNFFIVRCFYNHQYPFNARKTSGFLETVLSYFKFQE